MSIHKYKDWRGWLDGLREKAMEAGATSISTFLTSNGVDSLNIPGLHHVGLDWRTALGLFCIHTVLAATNYVRTKPSPDVVTVETDSNPAAFTKPPTQPPTT